MHSALLRSATLATLLWGLLSFNTQAQTQLDLGSLEAGQLILNLSATEQSVVQQDTLTAVLEYSAQGEDKVAIQSEVNSAIRDALASLENNAAGIDYSTRQYYVYPIRSGRSQETERWHAQQGLMLRSRNSEDLLDRVAELQGQGLYLSSLQYSLSRERQEEIREGLLERALESLQARANAVATSLSKQRAELLEVNLDGSQDVYFPREAAVAMRAMADDSVDAPPSAVPGESTVSLTVTAKALLSP